MGKKKWSFIVKINMEAPPFPFRFDSAHHFFHPLLLSYYIFFNFFLIIIRVAFGPAKSTRSYQDNSYMI